MVDNDEDAKGIAMLSRLRADLAAASEVRIMLTETFSISRGVLACARLYVPATTGNGRWRKLEPLLLPPEDDDTRAGMLRSLAAIFDTKDSDVG